MKNKIDGQTSRIIRLALALSLTSSAAFGVEFRAISLKTLPPAAVVVTPQAGLPLNLPPSVFSLISQNQTMAQQLVTLGPVVVLDAGRGVLMIPQTIRPGAQALVMPQDGGKAELVPITKEMATALRDQMKDGDIAGAAKTLGHAFDASSAQAAVPSETPVVAPETSAPAAASGLQKPKGRGRAKAGDGAASAPPAPPSASSQAGVAQNILKSLSANFKALLAKRPTVGFGEAKDLPVIGMPNIGDNFADYWTKAHAQSDALLIAAYNFDDMDMAKSIVAAIKAGKKVVFVGDYSNWFPIVKSGDSGHGKDPRTEAMKYLLANKNENLQLFILKGLGGASGINHNKFSVFSRGQAAQLEELAQTGSFNYTKTSQDNHFENFGFTDDKDRIAFLKNYHAWLVRRAKPFKEGLTEAEVEPAFPADDPIPVDKSRLTEIPFPKIVGTPKSDAGKWYVDFYEQAKQDVFGAMFAMFPTPAEVAAIEAKLAAGIPVSFIVDRGQVERAGALWGLMQKGMKLRVMAGPEKVIFGLTPNAEHSKLHMKVVTIDGGRAAKGVDSLNDSNNAEAHNFENLGFHEGYIAQFLYTYIKEVMWPLASEPSTVLMQKLEAEFNHSQVTSAAKGTGAAPASGRATKKPVSARATKKPITVRASKKPVKARTT